MLQFFDAYTLKHLDAWLDAQVNSDTCRAEVRSTMIEFAADDAEYWSAQGWWNLFDRAGCQDILMRHA